MRRSAYLPKRHKFLKYKQHCHVHGTKQRASRRAEAVRVHRCGGNGQSLFQGRRPGGHGLGQQVRAERLHGKNLRELARADASPHRPGNRAHRETLSESDVRKRGIRPAEGFPLSDSARRPDDRNRQQPADRLVVELLRDRSPQAGRLLRRNHPYRRGAGAADEAARTRRAKWLRTAGAAR